MNYLIVPGLNNSGPKHWQSFWAKSLPNAVRVEQRSWDKPQKEEWVETLDKAVAGFSSDTILVAHSLGVATTVLWLSKKSPKGTCPHMSREFSSFRQETWTTSTSSSHLQRCRS